MRLALELQALGLVNRIFPVFIGTQGDGTDGTSTGYDDFFAEGGLPKCADVAVAEVEQELLRMMESQALGTPIHPERTVASVMNAISSHHGVKVCGEPEPAVAVAIKAVVDMCEEAAGEGAEVDATRNLGSGHEGIRKTGSGVPRREGSGLTTPRAGRRQSAGEQSIDNHSLGSKPVTTRSPAVSSNPWKRQSQRHAPRGGDGSRDGSERMSSSNAAQSQAASQAVSQAVSRDLTRRVPKAPHAKVWNGAIDHLLPDATTCHILSLKHTLSCPTNTSQTSHFHRCDLPAPPTRHCFLPPPNSATTTATTRTSTRCAPRWPR